MKKPSKRKAREYYLTVHPENDPSWFINLFMTKDQAKAYKDEFLNPMVKIIKVVEILPKRRGAR